MEGEQRILVGALGRNDTPHDPKAVALSILNQMYFKKETVHNASARSNGTNTIKTFPSNIHSIRFFPFTGSMGGVDPRPIILFKDGTLCDCMDYDFGQMDVAAMKTQKPDDFGRWRFTEGKFEALWDNGSGEWIYIYIPTLQNQCLKGRR
jgi:hypothetical protein